jgi:pSer/pThr/pTyr-binding forkhead associated (FHA) protein
MTPKLIEPGAGGEPAREIPIQGSEFLLGRGSDCDLRLRDINISRHHCLIRLRPQEITLVDLGSSNGTFVNGQRVLSQLNLKSGDEIRLAEFRFFVDLGEGFAPGTQIPDVDPLAHTVRLSDLKKEMDREPPGV